MNFPDDGTSVWYAGGADVSGYGFDPRGLPGGVVELPPIPDVNGQLGHDHKGLEPVVQIFYEGPEKCECCINWIEKKPPQMPEIEKTKYEKAAICVYKSKNHDHHASRTGGLITLIDERVVIQSRTLLDAIRPAFRHSNTVIPEQGDMKFEKPFRELYFSYDGIVKVQSSLPAGEEAWKHVNLLVELISLLLVDMTWDVQQLRLKGCITYEYLWTLFPPSMIVYHKKAGRERLYKVTSTEKIYSQYRMNMIKTKTKPDRGEVEIAHFEGEKLIRQLETYPIAFHLDAGLAERCLQRGAKVLDFQEMIHCDYQGSAREVDRGETCLLKSRVIVDHYHFSKEYLDEIEIMEAMEDPETEKERDGIDQLDQAVEGDSDHNSRLTLPHVDFFSDSRPTAETQKLNRRYFQTHKDALRLMDPDVAGYALSYNKWYWLDVTKLSPIMWTSNPLERLVLEPLTKSVLNSFAQNHQDNLNPDADVLAAKGSGLVILLSGPPGTGKTLTAEAIAEEAHLPLYRILAGELGSTPTSIETKLSQVLDLATKWQAVVLLDEADTFIQKRESLDRISSEIVSIFLRQLEYFRGIMFLTTNRAGDIDTALRSRCRLHIMYETLSPKYREEVWNIEFRKTGLLDGSRKAGNGQTIRSRLGQHDWKALTAWELSGRDIHNVVENVILWCSVQGVDITWEKLEATIKVTAPLATQTVTEKRPLDGTDEPTSKRVRSN